MPTLERITLDGVSFLDDEPSVNWKRVFDAIRRHESIEYVAIKQITVRGGDLGCAPFRKDLPPTKKLLHVPTTTKWEDEVAVKELPLYMCGLVEWEEGAVEEYFSGEEADPGDLYLSLN